MAPTFRLANNTQTTVVNLLAGPLKLGSPWETRTPQYDYSYRRGKSGMQTVFGDVNFLTESFDLVAEDTIANLLAAINAIEALLLKARLFGTDDLRGESIWLEAYADGEPAKRALIVEGSIRYTAKVDGVSALMRYNAIVAQLAITRSPHWENIAEVDFAFNTLSCWGGKSAAMSNTGTSPARVASLQLNGANGGGGGGMANLSQFWAGIRPTYYGTSGYVPVWECEAGTPDNSSAVASESGASPNGSATNNKVRTNFGGGGTSLLRRVQVNAGQVTGISPNYSHMVGRYLVLLRCKLSAAGTIGVQLCAGLNQNGGAGALPANSEVFITNTGWGLVPLGEIVMPPYGYRQAVQLATALKYYTLEVWAERISGTPELDMDALCLIPSDHFAYVEQTNTTYNAGDTQPTTFYNMEDDAPLCLLTIAGSPYSYMPSTMRNLALPVEGGVLVLAGQGGSGHILTDYVNVAMATFPRWTSFRNT